MALVGSRLTSWTERPLARLLGVSAQLQKGAGALVTARVIFDYRGPERELTLRIAGHPLDLAGGWPVIGDYTLHVRPAKAAERYDLSFDFPAPATLGAHDLAFYLQDLSVNPPIVLDRAIYLWNALWVNAAPAPPPLSPNRPSTLPHVAIDTAKIVQYGGWEWWFGPPTWPGLIPPLTQPYEYYFAGGDVPPGFSTLTSEDGRAVLRGIPTATGTYTFVIGMSDAIGPIMYFDCSVVVTPYFVVI